LTPGCGHASTFNSEEVGEGSLNSALQSRRPALDIQAALHWSAYAVRREAESAGTINFGNRVYGVPRERWRTP
jgi:hypothetical protein